VLSRERLPSENWVELGKTLSSQGYQVLIPWGSPEEKRISTLIVSQVPGAIVPKTFSIEEAYRLVAYAKFTIGVDTGLTHLSAALGKPTVEIYCDSPRWKTEGYWNPVIANVGDMQNTPFVDAVLKAVKAIQSRDESSFA
jgi:heptosyltransferase-1